MLNNFRSKDKDTFMVFGFLCLIVLPFVIMSIDKFPDLINKLGLIAFLLIWNFSLSMVITSFLYINYIATLDNGVKINENKFINSVINSVFIAMYCLNIYMLIFNPAEALHSVSLFIFPVFLIQNHTLRPSIVIGDTYLTDSRQTVRIDSIKSIHRSKDESMTGISVICIKLKNDNEIKLRGSIKVCKLICEKANKEWFQ